MGLTHVTVALSSPGNRTRRWEALFLVDTGAIDCMAPATALREIGIQPEGKRSYELADGTEIQFEYGIVRIEFMGDVTSGDIIFGPDDCEPILGITALEHTGIVVDPKTNQLRRLPAVPLKSERPSEPA
jgi:clan AA aspartic protease